MKIHPIKTPIKEFTEGACTLLPWLAIFFPSQGNWTPLIQKECNENQRAGGRIDPVPIISSPLLAVDVGLDGIYAEVVLFKPAGPIAFQQALIEGSCVCITINR